MGAQAGLDDNAQSWSTVFEDFDNDGDCDAFIVNHDFQNRLFRNNGNGTFTNVIAASGINPYDLGAFENASGDFNNDGFIDIFSELQQRLYLGHGDLTFTGQAAPVSPGGIGDFNQDGFLDVVFNNQLWVNEGNNHHWLELSLLGIAGNRNGIGSRVEIYGSWGMQVRELRAGQSYSPMNSLNVHFGLGQATLVDSLVVKWPSGIATRLYNLVPDSSYLVPEASCLLPASTLTVSGSNPVCTGDTVQLTAPAGFAHYVWSDRTTSQTLDVNQEGYYYALMRDTQGCVSLTNMIRITRNEAATPLITASGSSHFCAGDTLILMTTPGDNYVWSNGESGVSSIAVTESGSYTVSKQGLCPDVLLSQPYAVIAEIALPPIVSSVTGAPGDSLLLTAIGENIHWYDQPTGGMLLKTGSFFQTPPLDSNMTYYVESHIVYPGEIQFGGKADTSGVGGVPVQVGYLLFETWQPFILRSVRVYVPPGAPAGTRFVQLYAGDVLLTFKQFVVQTGWNELQLDFTIPVGRFSLRSPQGNLFRNTGPLAYPYLLGDAGQITTSSSGDNFYYFFYNWQIETSGFECISERVPVKVLFTGTSETEQHDWRVFPIPASGQVFVEISDAAPALFFRLLDAQGREMRRQNVFGSGLITVDMSGFASGVYTFQLWQHGHLENKMIVIE